MTKMKDGAFKKVGKLKYEFSHFQDKLTKEQLINEQFQQHNKNSINNIPQVVKKFTHKSKEDTLYLGES